MQHGMKDKQLLEVDIEIIVDVYPRKISSKGTEVLGIVWISWTSSNFSNTPPDPPSSQEQQKGSA